MQARSGTNWLSDEDVGRVLSYLAVATPASRLPEPLSAAASAGEIFEVRCTGCHTLERIFTRSVDNQDGGLAWDHVVGRMRGKAPQWMTDTEAQRILEYLQDTMSVPIG
jgi:mono/diheme cytochrome c family protein